MSGVAVSTYRAVIKSYPRQFRDEYGPDLVLLFEDQLRDESSVRVVGRTLLDLVISVPIRHLEAHMTRLSPSIATFGFAIISFASLATAVIVGSNASRVVFGVLIALTSGSVALVAARRSRPLTAERPFSAHWWKFMAGGVGAIALFAAVTTATGELPAGGWVVGMAIVLAAVVTCATGIVLGVAHLVSHTARA